MATSYQVPNICENERRKKNLDLWQMMLHIESRNISLRNRGQINSHSDNVTSLSTSSTRDNTSQHFGYFQRETQGSFLFISNSCCQQAAVELQPGWESECETRKLKEISVAHLGLVKVLLCGVKRIWEHRVPLEGPGPPQDQEGNQSHCFVHPVSLPVHLSLKPEALSHRRGHCLLLPPPPHQRGHWPTFWVLFGKRAKFCLSVCSDQTLPHKRLYQVFCNIYKSIRVLEIISPALCPIVRLWERNRSEPLLRSSVVIDSQSAGLYPQKKQEDRHYLTHTAQFWRPSGCFLPRPHFCFHLSKLSHSDSVQVAPLKQAPASPAPPLLSLMGDKT